MEPCQLSRGKKFHKDVQDNFLNNNKDGEISSEKTISLKNFKNSRTGRIDIIVDNLGDFVAIYEIKSTIWDEIKEKNIRKNLYNHQKQMYKYIDKYLEIDKLNVCLGIIYPEPPVKPGLRRFLENYMEENYGIPVYWYTEIKS